MKRLTSMLLAVLALTIATAVAVQAQESTYPQSTTQQTATDPSATTPPADPAATTPVTDLPATASPMPLVALGGLASMAMGSALSRRRKA